MSFKVFCRSIPSDDGTEDELNRFLAGHRVVQVQTQWVTREKVPYLVFTNAQLAEMATSRADSLAALGRIDGVGEARIKKYGQRMLAVLAKEENVPAAQPPDGVKAE